MLFLKALLLTIVLSLLITPLVRRLAWRVGIVDRPAPPLKNHPQKTAKLGGAAVFLSLILAGSILFFSGDIKLQRLVPNWQYNPGGWYLCVKDAAGPIGLFQASSRQPVAVSPSFKQPADCLNSGLPLKYVIGLLLGAVFLIIGGVLDDKYNLKPKYQVIFPILAILAVIVSGISPGNITNPLYYLGLAQDPLLHLEVWKIKILTIGGVPYYLNLMADVFTAGWLSLLIYTTKFLDGLDGLVAGISVITAGFLFLISLSLGQPMVGVLLLILGGGYLGFLPYNFQGRGWSGSKFFKRNKIFLGEAGSTLAGYSLGVLAILGQVKVTATLLLLGLPILDAWWVIYTRIVKDRKSPFLGDRRHLHFRLLARGWSRQKSVLVLWGVCFLFGLIGLWLWMR